MSKTCYSHALSIPITTSCPFCRISELEKNEALWIAQNEENYNDNINLSHRNFKQFQKIIILEKHVVELKKDLQSKSMCLENEYVISDKRLNRITELEVEVKELKSRVVSDAILESITKTACQQTAREIYTHCKNRLAHNLAKEIKERYGI